MSRFTQLLYTNPHTAGGTAGYGAYYNVGKIRRNNLEQLTNEEKAKKLNRAIMKLMSNHKLVKEGNKLIYGELLGSVLLINDLLPTEWKFRPTQSVWSIMKSLKKEALT